MVLKAEVLQIDWNLAQVYIAISFLRMWCLFFQKILIYFRQIWSQNLTFSKWTEIWYRGTLLCGCYDFNVRFFKILFICIFLDKFGAKIWWYPNWLESFVYIHYRCYMLIIIKTSSISKFCILQIGEIILYVYAKFQWIWRTADFGMKLAPKIYERQILRKMTHQYRNQHITMCPCIKFQSIWRTLDFGTKFAQNNMNDKILKK